MLMGARTLEGYALHARDGVNRKSEFCRSSSSFLFIVLFRQRPLPGERLRLRERGKRKIPLVGASGRSRKYRQQPSYDRTALRYVYSATSAAPMACDKSPSDAGTTLSFSRCIGQR